MRHRAGVSCRQVEQPASLNSDRNYCSVAWFESIKFLFNFSYISAKCKIKRVPLCMLCESRHDLQVELEIYSHSTSLPSFSWLPIVAFSRVHYTEDSHSYPCHLSSCLDNCNLSYEGAALEDHLETSTVQNAAMCAYGLVLFLLHYIAAIRAALASSCWMVLWSPIWTETWNCWDCLFCVQSACSKYLWGFWQKLVSSVGTSP